jgi:hypothetical protein
MQECAIWHLWRKIHISPQSCMLVCLHLLDGWILYIFFHQLCHTIDISCQTLWSTTEAHYCLDLCCYHSPPTTFYNSWPLPTSSANSLIIVFCYWCHVFAHINVHVICVMDTNSLHLLSFSNYSTWLYEHLHIIYWFMFAIIISWRLHIGSKLHNFVM